MAKIVRVDALDSDVIDVQFANGQVVLLDMTPKRHDPAFAALWEQNAIVYPRTDGTRVFWLDTNGGPSVSLDEIFEMLRADV